MAYDAARVARVTGKLSKPPPPRPKQRPNRFGGRPADPTDVQDRRSPSARGYRPPVKDQYPRGMGSRQQPGQSSRSTTSGLHRDDIWLDARMKGR